MSRYVTKANLAGAFFENAAMLGEKPLLFLKSKGKWTGKNWYEIADSVRRLAGALVAAGIKPRDRVLISAENRPEWAIADLAVMSIGAIVVPAYTTNTEDDHVYIMEHSGALIAITSGGLLASRVALAASRVQHMRMLITMDPDTKLPDLGGRTVHTWQDLLAKTEPLADIDSRIAAQNSDDTCCFVYTSGTGGRPKGVMLTHRSIQACINASIEILSEGGVEENQRFLSLLPLSHSYEHTAGMHLPIQTKSEVWYCESAEQIGANLQEVSPSLMTAVPRLYDVLHERIMRSIRAKGGFSEALFMETVRLGRKRLEGQTLLPHEFFLDLLLERLIRQKIQARLGGKLKYFISGGAALNPEIGSFFMALDDGYITITGRKKEIIVNSGGENIVPSRVEALLTIEPEIEQALVDGDRRPWLAAVIVPSAEARAAAVSDEALKLLIAETVERANSRLSQIERVRRFIIADEGFTTENSQLTATLKVRRHIVRAQYQDRIAALYTRGKQD